MYTLDRIVLFQSSGNFVRMFILIKSRPELKIGHIGSKTRSTVNKTMSTLYRAQFDPFFMKLSQNVYLDKI